MSKCIFSLGTIDKRLYIPLLNIINYIVIDIYYIFFPEDDVNVFIYYFGYSLGEMMTVFVPYIFKYKNGTKKIKNFTKENLIDYSIYLFLDLLIILTEDVLVYFTDDSISLMCTIRAYEIFIIVIISILILKYKYYIHHIVSLVIFLLLSIIIDLMIKNYEDHSITTIVSNFLNGTFNVLGYLYIKYMMDTKYHYFWNINFMTGTFDFIIYMLLFIGSLILRFKYHKYDILTSLNKYNKDKLLDILIIFFSGLIFGGLIRTNLEIQTIHIFDPNHLFVCYEIINLFYILYEAEELYEYLSIIPFIMQIIVLFFYIEIFEFNFCGLNRNTKRNIKLREKEEILEIDDEKEKDKEQDISTIELENNYLIHLKEENNDKDESEDINI